MSGQVPLSMKAKIKKAAELYEEFCGHEADEYVIIDGPEDDVVFVVGHIENIGYSCIRDGESELYRHEFTENARPLLCSNPDGSQLYIVGGQYQFMDSGINDLDDDGNPIDIEEENS